MLSTYFNIIRETVKCILQKAEHQSEEKQRE